MPTWAIQSGDDALLCHRPPRWPWARHLLPVRRHHEVDAPGHRRWPKTLLAEPVSALHRGWGFSFSGPTDEISIWVTKLSFPLPSPGQEWGWTEQLVSKNVASSSSELPQVRLNMSHTLGIQLRMGRDQKASGNMSFPLFGAAFCTSSLPVLQNWSHPMCFNCPAYELISPFVREQLSGKLRNKKSQGRIKTWVSCPSDRSQQSPRRASRIQAGEWCPRWGIWTVGSLCRCSPEQRFASTPHITLIYPNFKQF